MDKKIEFPVIKTINESDGSTDGSIMTMDSVITNDFDCLKRENTVLKLELDVYKSKVSVLTHELDSLKAKTIESYKKIEEEEEQISNRLLKKIEDFRQKLKNLSNHYDIEEEIMVGSISRKINKLKSRGCKFNSGDPRVNERIQNLQKQIEEKQNQLEKLKFDKVKINNELEQEQECLLNKLFSKISLMEDMNKKCRSELLLSVDIVFNSLSEQKLREFQGFDELFTYITEFIKPNLEDLRLKIKRIPTEAPVYSRFAFRNSSLGKSSEHSMNTFFQSDLSEGSM